MKLDELSLQLVVGAIETMGVLLADYGHSWSEGERALYEEALRVLGVEDDPEDWMEDGEDEDDEDEDGEDWKKD